jgi:hypothetical protein
MVLKPMPCSRSPGMGSVRETEPGATTIWSYSISSGGPMIGCTVAVLRLCSIRVTAPETILQCLSSRRSGTTECRGEMFPAAASGRNGWYVMCGCGSTTVTSASRAPSFLDSRRAAYRPT